MTDKKQRPMAGPETQDHVTTTSGGTYGKGDYSKTAQRSRAHQEHQSDGLKSDRSAEGGPLKSGGAS